jgi:predicted nucleotidyltransferase
MFSDIVNLKPFLEDLQKEWAVREYARKMKIAPATASKLLNKYSKDRFLQKRKDRIYHLYKADIESQGYRDLKVYYNITKLRKSGLIEALNEFFHFPTIVLFGSKANGYDVRDSDYDIFVISPEKEQFKLDEFEKKLKAPIQLFVHSNLKEIGNKHLVNNMVEGITLQRGGTEWI